MYSKLSSCYHSIVHIHFEQTQISCPFNYHSISNNLSLSLSLLPSGGELPYYLQPNENSFLQSNNEKGASLSVLLPSAIQQSNNLPLPFLQQESHMKMVKMSKSGSFFVDCTHTLLLLQTTVAASMTEHSIV